MSYSCSELPFKVLFIDENGIQLGYDNGDVVLPWNDISGIRFLRKKEDGVRLGLLVVNHKNGEEVTFNLCRHAPINYFRIRRAIKYFSRREDIVMKSSNLLLMWLRTWYIYTINKWPKLPIGKCSNWRYCIYGRYKEHSNWIISFFIAIEKENKLIFYKDDEGSLPIPEWHDWVYPSFCSDID